VLSQPLYASVTLEEATSPVKLPIRHCFLARFLCGFKIRVDIPKEWCSIDPHFALAGSAGSHLRSTVENIFPVSNYSKAPRGLFVLVQVGRIFTAISISPGKSSRQSLARYAFRAGRNLPDKGLRYLRTVIVTAAVHWCLNNGLDIVSTAVLDIPALGRRRTLYFAFQLCRALCFS